MDDDGDVNMDDDEMGDDDEVAQAEGDAAAPGDLDGAILDPFLDVVVEDEGGDLSPDGMEGGLAGPDAVQPGDISQEQADIIFGEVEPLPEEEEIVEQMPYGPLTVQQESLRGDGTDGGEAAPYLAVASAGPSDGPGLWGRAPGGCWC